MSLLIRLVYHTVSECPFDLSFYYQYVSPNIGCVNSYWLERISAFVPKADHLSLRPSSRHRITSTTGRTMYMTLVMGEYDSGCTEYKYIPSRVILEPLAATVSLH